MTHTTCMPQQPARSGLSTRHTSRREPAHRAGAGNTAVSHTVETRDHEASKTGARAAKRETTGPQPSSTGNTTAQRERAQTRERSGAESNTQTPRSQAWRGANDYREWTPAESSGHNAPFPHGQRAGQVDGGGSARHSGQVPTNACPQSHRTGSVTGPHSTPAMRHSTVKGEHEERRGREQRLENAFPRSVYLQHRFQHRRVLQPPSEEKHGSARPVTTTTAATATQRTQPDGKRR